MNWKEQPKQMLENLAYTYIIGNTVYISTLRYYDFVCKRLHLNPVAFLKIIEAFYFNKLNKKVKTVEERKGLYRLIRELYEDSTNKLYNKMVSNYFILHRKGLPVNKQTKITSSIQISSGQSIQIIIGYTI